MEAAWLVRMAARVAEMKITTAPVFNPPFLQTGRQMKNSGKDGGGVNDEMLNRNLLKTGP
ncbi:MAG: hypothetical protein C0523_08505 [Cytophaga sp.]|nr:hypothetical protein [Cytophaga sp.]